MNPSKISIEPELLTSIESHCFSDLLHEVGGFLIGEINNEVTEIKGFIKAEKTGKEQTQLTFTHETWDLAFKRLDKDFTGMQIIGWYHSHPDFGVFLSTYDAFIQTNFFAQPGQLALVIDPIRGILGWFIAKDGSTELVYETETSITPTTEDKASVIQSVTNPRRITRQSVATLVIAVVISGMAAVLAYTNGAVTGETNATSEWQVKVEQLQGDIQSLNSQIIDLQSSKTKVLVPYRIKRGDTLWTIAERFYGSGSKYKRILDANPNLQTTGLQSGQTIQIPVKFKDGGE